MNRFQAALHRKNGSRPPVWFMRQAGRYHAHYQALRAKNSFMDLCKKPELACEVTMGPIQDFDFDAAILFSDLLFPLEAMGMGLTYDEGPKLDWHLRELSDLKRLQGGVERVSALQFQGRAIRLIREKLEMEKGLLGFVGGPFTLFCYAVEGSHQGALSSAKEGLRDGRFEGFNEKLLDLLAENMALQARAGADTIAVFDTCAGELDPESFARFNVPALRSLFTQFAALCPKIPITYYSKGTGPAHWDALREVPFHCLGVDWKTSLTEVLTKWSSHWAIQGNVDPQWLFLERGELERKLRDVFAKVNALPPARREGWVCGLGHGVLQKTPEESVRRFLKLEREIFHE